MTAPVHAVASRCHSVGDTTSPPHTESGIGKLEFVRHSVGCKCGRLLRRNVSGDFSLYTVGWIRGQLSQVDTLFSDCSVTVPARPSQHGSQLGLAGLGVRPCGFLGYAY